MRYYISLFMLVLQTALFAQDGHWGMVNPYEYEYDMSLYATLYIEGEAVHDCSNYELSAFVGNELRATGELFNKNGYSWYYFRIRSNQASSETVSFKMFEKDTGEEFLLKTTIRFDQGKMLGMPSNPFVLNSGTFLLGDANRDDIVDVGDVLYLLSYLEDKDSFCISTQAADVDQNGSIDEADVRALANIILDRLQEIGK